jgi:hypothetical protein
MTSHNFHSNTPISHSEAQLALLLRAADARNAAWRKPEHHRMNWKAHAAMRLMMMLAGGAASLAPRLIKRN